jgi:hypothetical protein
VAEDKPSKQAPTSNPLTSADKTEKVLSDELPSKEILELKKEILDLREQLLKFREIDFVPFKEELRKQELTFRETELLSFKEKIDSFSIQIKSWIATGIIFGIAFTFFGINGFKYLNIELEKQTTKLEAETAQKFNNSIDYYDKLTRALIMVNNNGCSIAMPMLSDILDKRPNDEVAFQNIVHCFNSIEDYDGGYEFLSKNKVFSSRKYRLLLSYHNPGFTVFAKSLKESKFEKEALELLQKAEGIGVVDEDENLYYPLYALLLLYATKGDVEKASIYASKINDLKMNDMPDWRKDINTKYFKQLEKNRPDIRSTLEKLLPLRAKPESATAPRNS